VPDGGELVAIRHVSAMMGDGAFQVGEPAPRELLSG